MSPDGKDGANVPSPALPLVACKPFKYTRRVRRPPMVWIVCFALVTLLCAGAAVAAGTSPVGTQVQAHLGDSVVFVVPRQIGMCKLGQVASGQVVGVRGNVISVRNAQIGGQRVSGLFQNKVLISVVPALGAQSLAASKVPAHELFLLGTGSTRGCDSRVLGPVSKRNVVGFTEAGMSARVGVVQQQLTDRITAEKYVAGVYLLFVAFFFVYLMIHAGRFSRLERELAALVAQSPTTTSDSAPSA